MGVDGPLPKRPVPVIHFHGVRDPIKMFHGGKGKILGVEHRAVATVIAWWVKANNCQPEPVEVKVALAPSVTASLYLWAPVVVMLAYSIQALLMLGVCGARSSPTTRRRPRPRRATTRWSRRSTRTACAMHRRRSRHALTKNW